VPFIEPKRNYATPADAHWKGACLSATRTSELKPPRSFSFDLDGGLRSHTRYILGVSALT